MSRLDELRRRDRKHAERLGLERPPPNGSASGPPPAPRRRWLVPVLAFLAVLVAIGGAVRFLGTGGDGGADARLAQMAEVHAEAVGLVVATQLDGKSMIATAWAIGPDRYVTNAHVIAAVARITEAGGRAEIRVNRRPDLRFPIVEAKIHPQYGNVRLGYDVGVLRIAGEAPATLRVAGVGELRKLASGYRIAYLGFPSENLVGGNVKATDPIATMQSGIVTSVSDFSLGDGGFEKNQFIRHNLAVVGGASGSPVFNAAGDVVAVLNAGNMNVLLNDVTRTASRAPSAALVNFAQRADLVDEVLQRGIPPTVGSPRRSAGPVVGTGNARIDVLLASLEDDLPWTAMAAPPAPSASVRSWTTRELLSVQPPPVPANAREEVVKSHPGGTRKRTKVWSEQGTLLAVRQYYAQGALQRHTPLLASKKHGLEIVFYGNGACCARTEYVEGRRHGAMEQFHPQGWLSRRTIYRDDAVAEPAIFYQPNGSPLDGEIKFFFTDMDSGRATAKVAKTATVVDGRMHGLCKLSHPTGESRGNGMYEHGWEHGSWLTCAKDGTPLRTWSCRHGRKHGMLKAHYPSGKIRYEGEYLDGKAMGDHRIHAEDGRVTTIGFRRPQADPDARSEP
jgi:antitoxin component YwqK of YwqJK toxin-antitoxin module